MTLQQIEERVEVLYGRLEKVQAKYNGVYLCRNDKALRLQLLIMRRVLFYTTIYSQLTTPQPKYPEGTL